jgi:hypothetical protein
MANVLTTFSQYSYASLKQPHWLQTWNKMQPLLNLDFIHVGDQ